MEIYSKYSRMRPEPIKFTEPSMTQQQFLEECDINNIIAQYNTTGLLTDPMHLATRQPKFLDCTNLPDYQKAQEIIIEAGELFDALPARIRKEFDNDPALMLAFCADHSNYDRAIELGLIMETAPINNHIDPEPIIKTEPKGEV